MNAVTQIPARMTVEEFMAWDAGDGRQWQLVDGVPEPMAPTNRTHAALQATLSALLYAHLRAHRPDCFVLANPGIQLPALARSNVRIPDLAVTCDGYTEEEALVPSPVLLIEVLSISNHVETWSNVRTYTSMPSVREILVVRTVSVGAELLRRSPDGTWPEHPTEVTGGELVLDSIGFRAPMAELYRTTRFG